MTNAQTFANRDHASAELHARIDRIGQQLSGTMRNVLDAIPGGPHRPQELSRLLGVSKDLSSRTLNASSKKDPLAVAYLMPGPASLRQLLRAAAQKEVSAKLIEEAEVAVRHFERLIQIDAGDRISLDGIISSWLPDARERFEACNKQAVFRGMAQLKGVMADVGVTSAVIHPGADGVSLDGVWILGSIGLRRIRPGAPIRFWSGQAGPDVQGARAFTLDRKPADGIEGLMLEAYCSSPTPKLDVRREGTAIHYVVPCDSIGPSSAVDLFVAEMTPGCIRRYNSGQSPKVAGPSSAIAIPVRTLVFDVLLHEDVYPGQEPSLQVYDTARGGIADINDPSRAIDLLDVGESIERLGWNAATFRASEIPQYAEIIDLVCDKMGWDGRKFRGYRCRVQYPVYASQFSMVFEPPTGS